MKLYHPALDRTIERNDRQAVVLRPAGWVPLDEWDARQTASELDGEPTEDPDAAPWTFPDTSDDESD